jgi:hypothetical protein
MAGGAFAAKGLITGKDVKNDSLRGKQIKESSLKQVPSAASAANATTANSAKNASSLGGAPASAYLNRSEPQHVIGTAGEPAFESGFSDAGPGSSPSFWKDDAGVVHLRGAVESGTATDNDPIFTLPPGYRPRAPYADFVVAGTVGNYNTLSVEDTGEVFFFAGTGSAAYVSLEGVDFPAAG